MSTQRRQTLVTKDGSHTLYVPTLDETYHSTNGALTESRHVFIQEGLAHYCTSVQRSERISVLEMGLGTGLNALLTLEYALAHQFPIFYIGVEAYPVDAAVACDLNYPLYIDLKNGAHLFARMHERGWSEVVDLHKYFQLIKIRKRFEDLSPTPASVDVIYFDAFAPSHQPEVWCASIIEKMYQALKDGGVLVTYCAQGQFRRTAQAVGFDIERLAGPPGKREMIRAVKSDRSSRV